MEGLEIAEHSGGEYKRLVDGPKWTVAALGHSERFDPRTPIRLERHLLTDETFVLLSGTATLLLGEFAGLRVKVVGDFLNARIENITFLQAVGGGARKETTDNRQQT